MSPLAATPTPTPAPPSSALGGLVRSAARLLDAPVACLCTVGDEPPVFAGPPHDEDDAWRARREAPLSRSLCRFVVEAGRTLHAADAREAPWARREPHAWHGEVGYAAAPVRTPAGRVVGCLCVADARPRHWTPEQLALLEELAGVAGLTLARGEAEPRPGGPGAAGLVGAIGPSRGRLSLRMIEKAIETMQVGVTITDAEGRILYTNPAEAAMHGYTVDELRGRHARIFAPVESHRPIDEERMEAATSWSRETLNVRRDGTVFPVLLRSDVVKDSRGAPVGLVTCCEDLTQRRALERRLLQNAFYDQLTGLPNRGLLTHRLDLAVERALRGEGSFAVLMLGLDRFKRVNDGLGREAGDELLHAVADRLRVCLRPDAMLARLAGDEFAVLLDGADGADGADGPADALRVAAAAQEALRRAFPLAAGEVFVTASAGVALSSSGYRRAEDVLRDAALAMYRVKDARPGECEVFDRALHARAMHRLRTEGELRHALERGEIDAHFQPVVALEGGRIAGFEALARWAHPERGPVPPDEFIPLAEETGLIFEVGWRVLEQACAALRRWRALEGWEGLTVAVNLSARQFAHPELAERVEAALRGSGVPGAALKLEITESTLLQYTPAVAETMGRLRRLGVQLCLDDFGTGYSSLSYLHRLPLDALKIDRSFVAPGSPPESLHLVRTIIAMARALDVAVVTEGVETREVLHALRALGCQYGQGFLFSAPLPADGAEALLRRDPRWP